MTETEVVVQLGWIAKGIWGLFWLKLLFTNVSVPSKEKTKGK